MFREEVKEGRFGNVVSEVLKNHGVISMAIMGEIAAFGKTLEVVENRVKVINQMLGYGCDGCLDNPLVLRVKRGRYVIDLCGDEFQSFAIWDCGQAEKTLNMLEGLNEGIWLLKRSRKISCTTK